MTRLFRIAAAVVFTLAPLVARADSPAPAATPKPSTRPATVQAVGGMRIEKDLKYGEAPGKSNLLDLYLPEHATGPVPLIIWIHGGGWQTGDKAGCPAVYMVPRGYAAASLNYRLSQEAIFPACIQDCKGAIRWIRAHAKEYQIDPDRIGVWGASAGGHLVALLGTSGDAKEIEGAVGGNLDYSSRVQAVCDWFGPTDMSRFLAQAGYDKATRPAPEKSALTALFGGPVDARGELVARANPLTFVSKTTAPFLIMHGDKDPLVPLAQSEILADSLKAAGVECHLEVLKGAGHGTGFNKPEIIPMMVNFFDTHLRPVAPAAGAK